MLTLVSVFAIFGAFCVFFLSLYIVSYDDDAYDDENGTVNLHVRCLHITIVGQCCLSSDVLNLVNWLIVFLHWLNYSIKVSLATLPRTILFDPNNFTNNVFIQSFIVS